MKISNYCRWLPLFVALAQISACNPVKPKLPELKAEAVITTNYTTALSDLNTVLEVYLPQDYPTVYYYVKPITDATGISQQGGEIPHDITALVRDAVSQVYHRVRYVEQYDESDIVHMQAETLIRQAGRLQSAMRGAVRPVADFTISGRISQFDRNLESTSSSAHGMGSFGEGLSRTDINASIESSSRISRLSVSFQVYDSGGISMPGKFGASTEVGFAKNGVDIGFAIFGNGFGFGSQATAMHGRHLALQMMSELSVVQIIGRTLTIPYWRVGAVRKIFDEDRLVIDSWRKEYDNMIRDGMIISFMQSQCIANGDKSIVVNGNIDGITQSVFNNFADKYGIKNRVYPNFAMFKALEMNRLLDRSTATAAWAAYAAYKNGSRPVAAPTASAPSPRADHPQRKPESGDVPPSAPAAPAPDVTRPLEDLL